MNNLYPLKKRILIKANEQASFTKSGITLEGTSLIDSRTATVISTGPDVTTVKPGYTVFVDWTKALPVTIKGNDYKFIDEEHIVAIYDNLDER